MSLIKRRVCLASIDLREGLSRIQSFTSQMSVHSSLPINATLLPERTIVSHNGQHSVTLHSDGNLVVQTSGRPAWATNTQNRGEGPYRLDMQEDGNLVIYDVRNQAVWASASNGRGRGPFCATMQDDGNFVIYDNDKRPIWSIR